MEVQSTTDYSIFKKVNGNRDLDMGRVKALAAAIEEDNQLDVNPILCDGEMGVHDGQYRLAAAEMLGYKIYFLVKEGLKSTSIATLNSNRKNWTLNEYVNYWVAQGVDHFDKLDTFLMQNPLIPVSTAIQLISSDKRRNLNNIRDGKINVDNYDHGFRVAAAIAWFNTFFESAYDRNFILALNKVFNVAGFEFELLKQKVDQQRRSVVRCISVQQYVEMFDEIYNYGLSKNRLRLVA